jgi:hypothetical protein
MDSERTRRLNPGVMKTHDADRIVWALIVALEKRDREAFEQMFIKPERSAEEWRLIAGQAIKSLVNLWGALKESDDFVVGILRGTDTAVNTYEGAIAGSLGDEAHGFEDISMSLEETFRWREAQR